VNDISQRLQGLRALLDDLSHSPMPILPSNLLLIVQALGPLIERIEVLEASVIRPSLRLIPGGKEPA